MMGDGSPLDATRLVDSRICSAKIEQILRDDFARRANHYFCGHACRVEMLYVQYVVARLSVDSTVLWTILGMVLI